MLKLITQMNSLYDKEHVSFQAKKIPQVTKPFVTAAATMAIAAGKALSNDVFEKETSEKDENLAHNLKQLPYDNDVLTKLEAKHNIKGTTYAEKIHSATSKHKYLDICIQENIQNNESYLDSDTEKTIAQQRNDCKELENYIDFIDSVSGTKYTEEDAAKRNALIEDYILLYAKLCCLDKQSTDYDDTKEDLYMAACRLANYGIIARIYTMV